MAVCLMKCMDVSVATERGQRTSKSSTGNFVVRDFGPLSCCKHHAAVSVNWETRLQRDMMNGCNRSIGFAMKCMIEN